MATGGMPGQHPGSRTIGANELPPLADDLPTPWPQASSKRSSTPMTTTNSPWLSILIPVYNVAPYLKACVESILSQDTQGVEVLLLDDVSTDESPALMQALQAASPGRLQLLKHERNGGLSAARNSLLQAASGRYIWFVDSDDLLMPGAIDSLRRIVGRHEPDLVLCDFRTVREPMKLKHKLRGELHRQTFAGPAHQLSDDKNALLHGLFALGHLHSWSKIARRQLWSEDLRFPEGHFFEDMATTPELALRARNFYYVPEVWLGYRQRSGSILASMSFKKVDDMLLALEGLGQRLRSRGDAFTADTHFTAAYYVAKAFICAGRFAVKHGEPERLPKYLQAFERCSPLSPGELMTAYQARGWLLRALRFRAWWRRSLNQA